MKKTVTTPEGHVINFSIENADGTPLGEDGLHPLERMLFETLLAKAEPSEDELCYPRPRAA